MFNNLKTNIAIEISLSLLLYLVTIETTSRRIFVVRAGSARQNDRDDVPLARRSNPYRRLASKGNVLLLIFTVSTLAFLLVGLTSSFFWGGRSLNSQRAVFDSLPSPDGRLLGHFPYPEARAEDLVTLYPGLKVHFDTAAALQKMERAAAAEGITLIYLSGYRSHSLQEEIFFDLKSARNQTAIERSKVSAPPGYSEHSTGYAIDIGDGTRRDTDFSEEFEDTRAFQWLIKNAARYHFTLSFPPENNQGVTYEPWHWRYEGTAEALRKFEPARIYTKEF